MICAPAASVLGARIPFGAAHRVYFDTPPLGGRCRALGGAPELLVGCERFAICGALLSALGKQTK